MVHADPFVPDELCGDGGFGRDWVPVGDVPDDPLFSVALAYQRFVRAVGRPRAATESMFMDRACSRPYTYSCLLTDFKRLCEAVGCDLPLGPHGLRVLGYNLSKAGNGVELGAPHKWPYVAGLNADSNQTLSAKFRERPDAAFPPDPRWDVAGNVGARAIDT